MAEQVHAFNPLAEKFGAALAERERELTPEEQAIRDGVMGTLAAKQGPASAGQTPLQAPAGGVAAVVGAKPDISDILASFRARKAQLDAQKTSEIPAELADQLMELVDAEKFYLVELEKVEVPGAELYVSAEELAKTKAALEYQLRLVREALVDFSDPVYVTLRIERGRIRTRIAEHEATLSALDSGNTSADSVTKFLTEVWGAGAYLDAPPNVKADFEWNGRRYVQKFSDRAIGQFTESVRSFLRDRDVAEKAKRQARHDEVAEYLISTQRTSENRNTSERDALEDLPGTVESLTRFLDGDGERYFLPIRLEDKRQGNGKTFFAGEALLEREGGRTVCRRVTTDMLARRLFFYFDKNKGKEGERVERGEFTLDVRGTDISRVKSRDVLDAMRAELEREVAAKARRNIADELRDVSRIANAITFAELDEEGKAGITPVDLRWTVKEERNGRIEERDIPLTFHLEGDGKGNFRIARTVDNGKSLEKIDLARYTEWHGLEELRRDTRWKAIRAKNAYFERDWRLDLAAAEHQATNLSKANYAGLFEIEGTDGVYAVRSAWREKHARDETPTGYIIQRFGDTLTFLAALPGTSLEVIGGKTAIGVAYGINAVPENIRKAVYRAYMKARGLKGKDGFDQIPAHLRPGASSDSGSSVPNGNGGSGNDSNGHKDPAADDDVDVPF